LEFNKLIYPNPTHFPPGPHFAIHRKMGTPPILFSGRIAQRQPAADI